MTVPSNSIYSFAAILSWYFPFRTFNNNEQYIGNYYNNFYSSSLEINNDSKHGLFNKSRMDDFDNQLSSIAFGNELVMDDIIDQMDAGDDGQNGDDEPDNIHQTPMGPTPMGPNNDDEDSDEILIEGDDDEKMDLQVSGIDGEGSPNIHHNNNPLLAHDNNNKKVGPPGNNNNVPDAAPSAKRYQ